MSADFYLCAEGCWEVEADAAPPCSASDLATIFQPGIIAHPDHEMLPSEHALSQKVLEFLINKQDHFLIGMELVRYSSALSC